MFEDFCEYSDCLKRNDVNIRVGTTGSEKGLERTIIAWKPILNLRLLSFKTRSPIPVPFLLDTGSDVSLLPKLIFKSLGRPPEKVPEKLKVTTVRGDFEADVHNVRFNFPLFGSTKYVDLQIGIVDPETPLSEDWIKKAFRKYVLRRKTAGLSGSAVKMFREGKIGILSANDFVDNFEYIHANLSFFVRQSA